MSSDKLLRAARAAGFAMACDDLSASAGPAAAPKTQGAVQVQSGQVTISRNQPLATTAPRRQLPSWNFANLGFWKTA